MINFTAISPLLFKLITGYELSSLSDSVSLMTVFVVSENSDIDSLFPSDSGFLSDVIHEQSWPL